MTRPAWVHQDKPPSVNQACPSNATGLLPPGSGGLFLDERLLNERERILWRRETTLVAQKSFLFNDSIRANLLCVRPDATDQQLWAVLDAVNCRSFVESRRGGTGGEVGERGALLHQPQLLVLDEPTNNLDAKSVAALLGILEKLKRHATLLVVSHDQRALQRTERVFRLEGGLLATVPGVETQCQT